MPNMLLGGQQPYEPSGYFMDNPTAVEVTLCHSPAVAGAKFRVVRSAGNASQPRGIKLQMPAKKNVMKQQVFGYVSIPWLEDWYGDVMDPTAIEHAAHSFLYNMTQGNSEGNGIGEEHMWFWNHAHVIQSAIDYSGGIYGVPGGWWFAVQITDPTTWQKVMSEEYTGFSLGSYVSWTDTHSEDVRLGILQNIPNMKAVSPVKPTKGKFGMFKDPGAFGFPTEQSDYADPANNKFPLNTRSRAYATLRYVLQNYDSEGYSIDELKFIVRRMLAAITAHGDDVPKEFLERAGFGSKQNVLDFAAENGMKSQSVPNLSLEEVTNMALSPDILEAIQTAVHDTVGTEMAAQKTMLDNIQKSLQSMNQQAPAPAQQTTPAAPAQQAPAPAQQTTPAAPAQQTPAPAQQTTPAAPAAPAQQTTPAPTQAPALPAATQQSFSLDDIKNVVTEVLKGQQAAPVTPAAPAPTPAMQNLNPTDLATAIAQQTAAAIAEQNRQNLAAMQGIADAIASMPLPRATSVKTMSADQKAQFIQNMVAKVQSGMDITSEEGRLAEQMGVDFNADNPFAALGISLDAKK